LRDGFETANSARTAYVIAEGAVGASVVGCSDEADGMGGASVAAGAAEGTTDAAGCGCTGDDVAVAGVAAGARWHEVAIRNPKPVKANKDLIQLH
jgi:hypothetical protein